MKMNPGLHFMQDNAPGHVARATHQELLDREISVVFVASILTRLESD